MFSVEAELSLALTLGPERKRFEILLCLLASVAQKVEGECRGGARLSIFVAVCAWITSERSHLVSGVAMQVE